MRYRVAWHSNVTGRNGEDAWKSDRDLVEADLMLQKRKWAPEMLFHMESMDASGKVQTVEISDDKPAAHR
jgi:hypothetical protein